MRAEITDSFLERRPFKQGGRLHVCDSRLIGFGCIIGGRTKILLLRQQGRELARWRWPFTTAIEARQQALDLLRRVQAGEPVQRARTAPASPRLPTLENVLDSYIETKGCGLRDRTARDYRDVLRVHAADWLSKPIGEISADVFLERYQAVQSPARAAYLLRVFRALVRFASRLHDLALPDPTAKAAAVVGSRAPAPRARRIADERQRAFYAATMALADSDARDLLLLLALTGLRLEEGRALRWEEVDLAHRRITLPGARTKNGREHLLPIGPRLVALLRARKEAQGGPDSGAVFKLSLHQLRRAYEAVSSAAGQFSPHDLRRGFATVAQRAMRDEALTKWLLNHAPQGVTQAHYLTRDEARLREAMERVEAAFYSAWT